MNALQAAVTIAEQGHRMTQAQIETLIEQVVSSACRAHLENRKALEEWIAKAPHLSTCQKRISSTDGSILPSYMINDSEPCTCKKDQYTAKAKNQTEPAQNS